MVKAKKADKVSIQKTQSCPPHGIGSHFSRWGVAKMHMKQRLVKAGERLASPSFRVPQDMAPAPPEYADGKPIALVGPVIGLVTSTAARILLEVDRDATVEMILHKEERGELPHGRPPQRSKSLFSERLLRGSSSPLKLGRSTAAEAMPAHAESMSSPDDSAHFKQEAPSLYSQSGSTLQTEKSFGATSQALSPSALEPCSRSSSESLYKSENATAQDRDLSASSSSLSKSSSPWRAKGAKGSHSLQRRSSLSFMKKLWRESSLSYSLQKQSSPLLSQGGGQRNRKDVSIIKEMQARRPSIFKFEMLEPESQYIVEVKDCHKVEQSSFKTFPLKLPNQFCIASISCNSIFITKKTITTTDDLWHHLSKSIELKDINLLVHLGDQIYGDGDRHLDAGAGKNRDRWSNRFKIGLDMLKDLSKEKWPSKLEDICEKYREVYRDTWRHPYTAKCLANCSSLMIYDDHEIRDNWGDNPRDWLKDSMEYFVAKCAWMVALEYQRQLFEDVDFSRLDDIKKDHFFHVIDKIGLMFLDIRGSRTFHRVENDVTPYLGSRQWQDIDEALGDGGIFNKVQVLVVCSPAPLVFLVPAVTVTAPAVVDRLEDFKGHWSAYKHEQKRMIDSLQNWKESRNGREVVILGGDVHCGGHSCILKSDKTLFNQLTTSPIANMPLPKTVYYAMRFAEQLERIEGFRFHHFNWTRARNYGLIHINFLREDENNVPEVVTELVRGKFLRPVRTGRRVSNLETNMPTVCCAALSFQSHKTRSGMPCGLCMKGHFSGGTSSRNLISQDVESTSEEAD